MLGIYGWCRLLGQLVEVSVVSVGDYGDWSVLPIWPVVGVWGNPMLAAHRVTYPMPLGNYANPRLSSASRCCQLKSCRVVAVAPE